ncbi:MAG TPA: YncE family protein [Myxococcota bacterium]|nr:YncE family protein [Myxococcota bacterium]
MRTPFLLPLALSWACSADYGAVGDADYGDDTDASPGDGPSLDTGSVFTPGETEDDRRWLRPAESDVFVFVANPANDTVTRVNARTLEVRTAQVGRDPSAVAVTPGWSTAVVFNQGDATVSIVDAGTLAVQAVPVRPNLNRLELSPDGRWAALWHDVAAERPDDPRPGGATSYNEMSLVDVDAARHFPLVVGFAPKGVRFTPDGALALAVADASLASIDLSGDAPDPSFLPIADPLQPPIAEEVEVAPDGSFAFVRQRGTDLLTVVDLATGEVTSIPVGAGPTDLDLTPDGGEVVLVSRDAAEVARFAVDDPFASPEVTPIPGATPLGSILIGPGDDAILFTNASALGRYATWTLGEDDMVLHPLAKPAASIARTPDGRSLLVTHTLGDNPDGSTPTPYRGKPALSLIDLDDQRTNTLALGAAVSGLANAASGRFGYVILDGQPELEVLDYATLIHTEVPLRSDAVFVGVLPGLSPGDEPKAWVSQEHDLGRISFYDPDDGDLQTITGFELNSHIED